MGEVICTCDWPSDDECPRHFAEKDTRLTNALVEFRDARRYATHADTDADVAAARVCETRDDLLEAIAERLMAQAWNEGANAATLDYGIGAAVNPYERPIPPVEGDTDA